MKSFESEFMESIAALPPLERAAAISHHAYALTAGRVGWALRVPRDWFELSPDAQKFNIESSATWARNPELLAEWLKAIEEARTSARDP